MSRLTRDGAAEPVSRDQILRRERGQGNINFPCSADHEQNWQPYPFDPYSELNVIMMHTHTKSRTSDCLLKTLRYVIRARTCREGLSTSLRKNFIDNFRQSGEIALRRHRNSSGSRLGGSEVSRAARGLPRGGGTVAGGKEKALADERQHRQVRGGRRWTTAGHHPVGAVISRTVTYSVEELDGVATDRSCGARAPSNPSFIPVFCRCFGLFSFPFHVCVCVFMKLHVITAQSGHVIR